MADTVEAPATGALAATAAHAITAPGISRLAAARFGPRTFSPHFVSLAGATAGGDGNGASSGSEAVQALPAAGVRIPALAPSECGSYLLETLARGRRFMTSLRFDIGMTAKAQLAGPDSGVPLRSGLAS
jgi:hypothetical protein